MQSPSYKAELSQRFNNKTHRGMTIFFRKAQIKYFFICRGEWFLSWKYLAEKNTSAKKVNIKLSRSCYHWCLMNESIVLHYFFYQGELLSHMKVPGSKASSDSHSNNNKKPTCTEACINLYALNWMYLKVKNKTKKEPLTFSALCTEFPLKFLLIITLLYWMWYCLWHITWFSLLTFLLIVRIETANPKTGLNFEIWQNRGFFHILNGELHTITEQNYLCMSWLK